MLHFGQCFTCAVYSTVRYIDILSCRDVSSRTPSALLLISFMEEILVSSDGYSGKLLCHFVLLGAARLHLVGGVSTLGGRIEVERNREAPGTLR